jgi:hypothetical protein
MVANFFSVKYQTTKGISEDHIDNSQKSYKITVTFSSNVHRMSDYGHQFPYCVILFSKAKLTLNS